MRAFAHHDGGIFTSAYDNAGLGFAYDSKAVCSGEPVRCRLHRRKEISVVGLFDKMGDYFGVGLAREDMPSADELFFQAGKILYDAVVNNCDIVRASRVRVGVALARLAMRRPTRVTDAANALYVHGFNHRLKTGYFADLVLDVEAGLGLHGNTSRIVTAVFHAPQAAKEDFFRLQRARISDDSAHNESFRKSNPRANVRKSKRGEFRTLIKRSEIRSGKRYDETGSRHEEGILWLLYA